MPDRIHPERLTRSRRSRLLALATLVGGVLLAGCGGSSSSPPVATGGGGGTTAASTVTANAATTAGSRAATNSAATSSGASAPDANGSSPGLAFADCMRANGVPNFPDPEPGSGAAFQIPAGSNPAAPAFKEAQAKCRKLMPGGLPGSGPGPSAQTIAKLVRIAQCMRQHGVSAFPDPRTSVPSNVNPSEFPEITDFDGAILLFPASLNMQAPAYRQALTACGAPPLGLPH